MTNISHSLWMPCLLLSIALFTFGCGSSVEDKVILRSTVDQDVAAPILAAFHRQEDKQIHPLATFGVPHSSASEFLRSFDAGDFRGGDVVWTDNVLLMIALQNEGLLQTHDWTLDPSYPADMRARDRTWCGFAATARVLLVNTDRLPQSSDHPTSVEAVVDPAWKKRCAIALPVAEDRSTSVTAMIHAAIIAEEKGTEAAEDWFQQVASNAVVMPSNAAVATAVSKGQVDWGITDSSDAIMEQDAGNPVTIVFPDQGTQDFGTVRIPHTVAILKNAVHPNAARRLADYLVLPTTEDRLAMSDAAQIPLSRTASFRPRVLENRSARWAEIDLEAAAKTWTSFQPMLLEIFKSPSL